MYAGWVTTVCCKPIYYYCYLVVLSSAYVKQLDASIVKRIDALTKLHGNTHTF